MDINIQNNLCKNLRACGLNKESTLELTNTIAKWVNSSGAIWTVERLKTYQHWFKYYMAEKPYNPCWIKKSRAGTPTGIFGRIFKIKNPAKAMAILSCHSAFKSEKILAIQTAKFLEGLDQEPLRPESRLSIARPKVIPRPKLPMLDLNTPTFGDISGVSIPINRAEGKAYVDSPESIVLAYADSWQNVPIDTLRFIRRERQLQIVPPALLQEGGVDGIFSTLPSQESEVGWIGCIQEASFKARWIANPNRICQALMKPLGSHWYHILSKVSTDCTYNQEKGISWCQTQLNNGIELSGADLTSATDLLDRESCLRLICKQYLYRDWDNPNDWSEPVETIYRSHITHFMDISSKEWAFRDPEKVETSLVKWSRGQPLGTYPSFAMLGLTNNILGHEACLLANIQPDSFRVIGDDIIMDSRAMSHYCELVEGLGGKINHSKTITSDKLAEFAGRIILPKRDFPVKVKYKEPSDNSFLAIVTNLGDQAKGLLRPRQRKVYELFKFVPGVAVSGPYSKNSFGFPLVLRYTWYLIKSGLTTERVAPDKESLDSVQFGLKLYYTLSEKGRAGEFELSCPYTFSDDFQSSLAQLCRDKGNPMLKNGKTALQVLEEVSSSETFESFYSYIKSNDLNKNLSPESKTKTPEKVSESKVLEVEIPRTPLDENLKVKTPKKSSKKKTLNLGR